MFLQNRLYTIHLSGETCGQTQAMPTISVLSDTVKTFLKTNYPKQKLLGLVFDILLQKGLVNNDLYFVDQATVHIIDFIRFINNKFDKNDKPPANIRALLKTLQSKDVRLPNACVNNPVAKKVLC